MLQRHWCVFSDMPHELSQSQVFLNGNHMSAQNCVITMLVFLALPGKGALSNQLEFIYLHTISGWECSFFYADAEKIYISSSNCNFCWILLHFAAITSLVFSYFPPKETFLTTKQLGTAPRISSARFSFVSDDEGDVRAAVSLSSTAFPPTSTPLWAFPCTRHLVCTSILLQYHLFYASVNWYLQLALLKQHRGERRSKVWRGSAGLLSGRSLWTAVKRKLCVSGKPNTTQICTGLNHVRCCWEVTGSQRRLCGGKCIPGTPKNSQSSATGHPAHHKPSQTPLPASGSPPWAPGGC